MSNAEDAQFWDLVDVFIERANAACDDADPGLVSAALLNAAARFNAFVVASSSIDRKEYIDEIEQLLAPAQSARLGDAGQPASFPGTKEGPGTNEGPR